MSSLTLPHRDFSRVSMMISKVLIVFVIATVVVGVKVNSDRVEDLKKRLSDIKSQLHDEEAETRSERLKEIVDKIELKTTRKNGDVYESFLCGMCYTVIEEFLKMRRIQNKTETFLKTLGVELCTDFEVQSEEVCFGVIELYAPTIFYIVDNRRELTADTVCKLLLNDGDCMNPLNDNNLDFVVDIDNGTSKDVTKKFAKVKESSEDLTIIHMTDVHVDFKYTKGAFADCNEFVCCRETDDVNDNDPEANAGLWGDYRSCDTPWRAVVDAFQQIKKQHSKIDVIYFTGDIVDHFLWDTSIASMKNAIERVFNLMRTVFGDIPIYSILGNHEAQNIFPPADLTNSSISVQWLYNHVARLWAPELPPDALKSVALGGFYTILVRQKLRLIGLNNNVCLTSNWWILFEVDSIQRQFQWLHDVLLAAENAGEKVHILAHIPNGLDDYHQPCSREYRRIVDRFHHIISGQFLGHTEIFGFNIFHENNNAAAPVNIAWNAGSLATYSGVNRNYVAYIIDYHTFQVKDVESWIYNLTDANQNELQNPIWFRHFSLREAFNLKDLSPLTMNNFMNGESNDTKTQQLWRMRIKNSDLMLKDGCSKTCQQEMMCDILIADNNDVENCQRIKKRLGDDSI